MSCPPAILEKLKLHRETLLHGEQVQEWVSRWWAGLLPDDRRTIMAFAGLDDSAVNARRPWLQYLQTDRDAILKECKRLHRLTDAVRWA